MPQPDLVIAMSGGVDSSVAALLAAREGRALAAFTLRLSGGRGRVRCRATVEDRVVSECRLNFALTEPPSA